jgi:hypothetical protein
MGLFKTTLYGFLVGGFSCYTVLGRLRKDVGLMQDSLHRTRLYVEETLRGKYNKDSAMEPQEDCLVIPSGLYWNEMLRKLSRRLVDDRNPMDSLKAPVAWKDIQDGYKVVKHRFMRGDHN